MTSRDEWIDEGLTVLREQGNSGVRVDRIAARLGLTKGSFHHHFTSIGEYRSALLSRYETAAGDAVDGAIAAVSPLAPREALMALPAHIAFDLRLDAAVRGWAFEDQAARAAQERVDAARLNALIALWNEILPDPARARIGALIPHLILVGGSAAFPPPSAHDIAEAFEWLATLVPAVD